MEPGSRDSMPARMIMRGLGFAICLVYLVLGTAIVVIVLIGGLWEGFNRAGYALGLVILCAYVYGTAWVAFRFGLKPARMHGLLLAALVAPVIILGARAALESRDLGEAATIYAENDDPEEVESARQAMLAKGRRAGRNDHVEALLTYLEQADDDTQRIRLVCMLGEVSYQYEPVLTALRMLREETHDDPDRRALNQAVEHALQGVNPYESGLRVERNKSGQSSLAACLASSA